MKKNYKYRLSHTVMKVSGLLLISIALLISYRVFNNADLKRHKVENRALVKDIAYFDYVENERSQQHLRFYRVSIQYLFKGKWYDKTLEMQPGEYKSMIRGKLSVDETIKIIHSSANPLNVKIINQ